MSTIENDRTNVGPIITRHAATRFQRRHVPHLSESEAWALLATLTPRATMLAEKSFHGQDQWLVDEPGLPRFIYLTKDDPACGAVCVTVLTESMQAPTAEEIDEAAAASRRLAASHVTLFSPPPKVIAYGLKKATRAEKHAAHEKDQQEKKAKRKKDTAEAAALAAKGTKEAAEARKHAKKLAHEARLEHAAKVRRDKLPKPKTHVTIGKFENMLEHAARMSRGATEAKRVTRVALRALRLLIGSSDVARDAWRAIGEIDSSLLCDTFIDYEKASEQDAEQAQ